MFIINYSFFPLFIFLVHPLSLKIMDHMRYRKTSHRMHILERPDTYIGSCECEETRRRVYTEENGGKMIEREVRFNPGLMNIFNEILMNAVDNYRRDPTMTCIRVNINPVTSEITVFNNGQGIPVIIHSEHNVYIPEMIFGQLLTSSNYDDSEKKTTGGRNGYGAKLANIFSSSFTVHTVDSTRQLYYEQTWKDNMATKCECIVRLARNKIDYTQVKFVPELGRFGMTSFDEDTMNLFKTRMYDVAGTSPSSLQIYFNNQRIRLKGFKEYARLHIGGQPLAYERLSDRWEVCVTSSDGQFKQLSFVNGLHTSKGGQHVNFIVDQVTKGLAALIAKGKKTKAKPAHIKNYIWCFVNAIIENPTFDTQTKETMTLKRIAFESVNVSEKFVRKVADTGVIQKVLSWSESREKKELKRSDGRRTLARLTNIPKLEDANWAGTKRGHLCTLILTEGDSAKALVVSGMNVIGRDKYGVFPLKGKLLNVREASHGQIVNNQEISYLKQIIGLQQGKVYDDVTPLRYGHVMIMTDQDHDGSHIKGLLINLFHHFWPSLLRISGFLKEFITPIVKCTKGNSRLTFYTLPQFEEWKQKNNEGRGWSAKYYKGLGTSTAADAKEYFSNLRAHTINFHYAGPRDDADIQLAFSKKLADSRKKWLSSFVPGTYLDQNVDQVTYSDFINKELILFSAASNQRAIPSIVDGLKPGQRKILFACFKRKLTKEIKVAQLGGYVSEQTAYHHGEAALCSTITALAHDFVGSNNIPLLVPSGQFGTRHMGGKDSASPRYIFTMLSPIVQQLFKEEDEAILDYIEEDGHRIEPQWYLPIIPTVLVNGSSGIGTGWSTSIPNYNPQDIIANIMRLIKNQEPVPMEPWYKGFTGEIRRRDQTTWITYGRVHKINSTSIQIIELPVQEWTHSYKIFLEKCVETKTIQGFTEDHTNQHVRFTLSVTDEQMKSLDSSGLHDALKLTSVLSTSNMVLFNAGGKLTKYATVNDVLTDFYQLRIKFYTKRKEAMVDRLQKELLYLSSKASFVLAILSGELDIRNKPVSVILSELKQQGYPQTASSESLEHTSYDYLLNMRMSTLTNEKVTRLVQKRDQIQSILNHTIASAEHETWITDLKELSKKLVEFDSTSNQHRHDQELLGEEEIPAPEKHNSVRIKKRGVLSQATTTAAKKAKTRI